MIPAGPVAIPTRTPAQLDWLSGALSGAFLSPLGLAALFGIVPILVLYLLRPDPDRLELPTARFLLEDEGRDTRLPGVKNLQRTLLLLIQVLVVVALATSLASPYVAVSESRTVEETVLVVDASASMATATGSGNRLDAALGAARDAVTDRTTVVVAGDGPSVPVRRGPPTEVRQTLSDLRVRDAPGDLRAAIRQASALAGENARIVVVSDFAGESDWQTPVEVARARGYDVDLQQFGAGGEDNVGVVATSFDDGEVTATVTNFGDARTSREVTLGGRSRSVTLGPGDATTVTLPVPAGGGTLRLSPGDDFRTDDAVAVAAPPEPKIEVLLLTNRGNRRLRTALSVIDAVELTVKHPPATITAEYDVVVFGAVSPSRVLDGTVQVARETLAAGGGVVVKARSNVSEAGYGDLLLVDPRGTGTNATLADTRQTPLTRGISFPAPGRYVDGPLTEGRALVSTLDGTPVLARAQVNGGRVLYYGYYGEGSLFQYNYMYPVFWRRVAFDLSGRPSLSALNHETGQRLAVEGAVATPDGRTVEGPTTMRAAGFYEAGDRRYAAALLSPAESAVATEPIDSGPGGVATGRTEEATVPRDLTPFAVAAAALLVLLELGYLAYRGDL